MHRPCQTIARSLACLALLMLCACATTTPKTASVDRLYAMYCGEAQIPDISPWSPGYNVGQPMTFADNCYLIQHGDDWMLWDSGFSDALAQTPEGVVGARNMRTMRKRTLASQLAEVGVPPDRIRFVAFSHTHGDHVGNSALFPMATVLIQAAEYDAAFGPEPARFGFAPSTYPTLKNNPVVKLTGDYDVFGDGSVRIVSTPGHTPGHQSLLVRLPKSRPLILSGDVAHFQENFDNRRVPGFNYDIEQSKRSMDRLAELVKTEGADLWINHDAKQNAAYPHAPQFIQ